MFGGLGLKVQPDGYLMRNNLEGSINEKVLIFTLRAENLLKNGLEEENYVSCLFWSHEGSKYGNLVSSFNIISLVLEYVTASVYLGGTVDVFKLSID